MVKRFVPTCVDRHHPPGGRILLAEQVVRARVRELGAEITKHYHGERPVLLGVMNGALFFLTDLLREVDLDTEICCVRLASYTGTQSRGNLRGLEAINESFAQRRVLVVDDILDSGRTLAGMARRLRDLGAVEVKTCVLLQKERDREIAIHADWIGFRIADEFVVGYGLDHDGRYRSLGDIWVFPGEATSHRELDSSPSLAVT